MRVEPISHSRRASSRGPNSSLPIYIIHWNDPDRLIASVASIAKSEGVATDVTVIDNGSTQRAIDLVANALPRDVRILRLPVNIGFAGAANEAIRRVRQSKNPWFAIAAHDVVVRSDTLGSLVACMQADPTIGIAGPLLTSADGTRYKEAGGRWLGAVPVSGAKIGMSEGFVESEWLQGCLLLVRLECADTVGGFWSELFAYCEDVDFCLRARDAGWRVGVETHARAHESGTVVPTDRRIYLITRNWLAITKRQFGSAALLKRAVEVAFSVARSFGGSIAPWRKLDRRDLSRTFCVGQAWGLIDGLRGHLGPGHEFNAVSRRLTDVL
jgi:GT2 family glycosyltransferase